MFRAPVIAVIVTSILGVGAWGALQHSQALEEREASNARRELSLASRALPALHRLTLEALKARASSLAARPTLLNELQPSPKGAEAYVLRHERVEEVLQGMRDELTSTPAGAQQLTSPSAEAPLEAWRAGRPTLLFAVDAGGVCVAHITNPRCYADNAEGTEFTRMAERFPALKGSLTPGAQSSSALWEVDGKPLLVATSPITSPAGELRGALVIGYPLNEVVSQYARRLGVQVALTRRGVVSDSSSFDMNIEQTLSRSLKTLKAEGQLTLDGAEHKVARGPLSDAPGGDQLGFVVTLNWSERLAQLPDALPLLMMSLLAALLSVLTFVWRHTRFVEPFKEIDLGLIEVQNGNRDYWFSYTIADNGVSKTIAQNLDILLSRLLGRPEPEFESDEERR